MASPQEIIEERDGRYWLLRDALHKHNELVPFHGVNGVMQYDQPTSLSVFPWKDDWYEVVGWSQSAAAWLVEKVTVDPLEVTPSGRESDPRNEPGAWVRSGTT